MLLGTQALQRADDFVQQIGGDLGVKRCRFKLLMAKQHLNHTDIYLLFEQVRGKTVAQRMLDTRLSICAASAAARIARFSCRGVSGSTGSSPGNNQPPSGILP